MIYLNKPTRKLVEKTLTTGKPSIYFSKSLNRWVFDDNGATPLPFNATPNGNTPVVGSLDYIQIAPMLYVAQDEHFLHFKGFFIYNNAQASFVIENNIQLSFVVENVLALLKVDIELPTLDYQKIFFAKGQEISNLLQTSVIDWGNYYARQLLKEIPFNINITKSNGLKFTQFFINIYPMLGGDYNNATFPEPNEIYLINFNNFAIPLAVSPK